MEKRNTIKEQEIRTIVLTAIIWALIGGLGTYFLMYQGLKVDLEVLKAQSTELNSEMASMNSEFKSMND